MSYPCDRFILVKERKFKMNETRKIDSDLRICVYCYGVTYAYVCPACHEYDGLMPILDAEEYLGEDLTEYLV
jgi:hypothetical protein